MKKYLIGFWYSLPVQLLFLHFRKYQLLLLFWYILFATITGHFMKQFGASSLFLAPEYFDKVSVISSLFVGFAVGIFIMSWNITTFILHHRMIKFLATTAQPFLKYCINNAIIPLVFLGVYFFEAVSYDKQKELMKLPEIMVLVSGFIGGFILSIIIAFVYFFGADKTIYRSMASVITTANKQYAEISLKTILPKEKSEFRIDWFLSARFRLRKPRDVRHYSQDFLDSIFKRHHIAAVIALFVAFICLVGVGFISDKRLFQVPAAASITVFFAILIAVAGAFSTFLKNWSIFFLLLLYVLVNFLYEKDIIDPRNKAYGLNYQDKEGRPQYNQESIVTLASEANIAYDKQQFIQRLNNWKARQKEDKPVMYIINTSGGGIRSAAFTFNTLQSLDSLMQGELMKKTFFINGASGGLLGAAYYRELYYQQQQGKAINLRDKQYTENISRDLLSPLFSSFVSRDILGPVQKFKKGGYSYNKDRGYAFEQKLNENTHKVLDKTLQDYQQPEDAAIIPTMFFNSVVSQDGRKMIMCTRPARFLMHPGNKLGINAQTTPDAIDFNSFFAKQQSTQVSILSALRMNATFPYVLPNVWLPTDPIIDVMDAGLRDNFGQENTLRFIDVFRDWLKENTRKVVVIQIRDRSLADWEKPSEGKSLLSMMIKPAFLLQYNWYKLQDYYQNDQLEYLATSYGPGFERVCFQYVPSTKDAAVGLSFHLTESEKKEIARSLNSNANQTAFKQISSFR